MNDFPDELIQLTNQKPLTDELISKEISSFETAEVDIIKNDEMFEFFILNDVNFAAPVTRLPITDFPYGHHAGPLYHLSSKGNYECTSLIQGFPKDGVNITDDHIDLLFEKKGGIESTIELHCTDPNDENCKHRDAIQLFTLFFPFAGTSLSDITIHAKSKSKFKITSPNRKHYLQALTGFDGYYKNINISNVDIEVQSKHGITFNGLRNGNFHNIKIKDNGGSKITLNPMRLCGGGRFYGRNSKDNIPTIWIVEPARDDLRRLYHNVKVTNSEVVDNRMAFAQFRNHEKSKAVIDATNRFKKEISRRLHNTEIYYDFDIGHYFQSIRNEKVFKETLPQGSSKKAKEDLLVRKLKKVYQLVKQHGRLLDKSKYR